MEYVVIFEEGGTSCSVYFPDLLGSTAVGETMDEVKELIAEAIDFHIAGLREIGDVVPLPFGTVPVQSDPGVSSALIAARV